MQGMIETHLLVRSTATVSSTTQARILSSRMEPLARGWSSPRKASSTLATQYYRATQTLPCRAQMRVMWPKSIKFRSFSFCNPSLGEVGSQSSPGDSQTAQTS